MSYATNIGRAISLRTPERTDYWLRRFADDLKLQKQEEAKAKAAQAEKLATIYDIDLKGGYLPAWGKAAKQKYADYVNAVADLRAQDPNVSYAKLIMLKNETKAQIENLKLYSDGVKAYITNSEYAHDPNWVKAAYESEDFNEIAKHNNPTYYNVVPETGYTFLNPVKVVTPNIQWGDQKQETFKEVISRGGVSYNIMQRDYPSETSKAISSELKLNEPYREFIAWKLTQNNENKKRPDEDLAAWSSRITPLVDARIDEEVEKSKPPAYTYEETVVGQGKGGGGEDQGPTQVNEIEEDMIDRSGKVFKTKKWESAVYSPFSITLNSNGAFYDKSNNRWIPSNIGGRIATFNFRPTQIQIVKTRDPKFPNDPSKVSYKKYAVGQIYRGTSDQATTLGELLGDDISPEVREDWKKTYVVAVPLEDTGVLGLIKRDKRNDLTLFNQKYEELTKGETAKKQQGGGSGSGGGAGDDIF